MTFINQYNRSGFDSDYFYTAEFTESGRQIILAVGSSDAQGIITKLTPEGEVIWQKQYRPESIETPFSFRKIIRVNDDRFAGEKASLTQYILHGYSNGQHSLCGIDTEGNVLWYRIVSFEDLDTHSFLLNCPDDGSFYFVLSDKGQADTYRFPVIIKFNYYGDIIDQKILSLNAGMLIINAATVEKTDLVMAGRIIEGQSLGIVAICRFREEQPTLLITKELYCTFHDIKVIGEGKYLVSGYENEKATVFTTVITAEEGPCEKDLISLSDSNSALTIANGMFYLIGYSDTQNIIFCFDLSFKKLWVKQISLPGDQNSIWGINYNASSNMLNLIVSSRKSQPMIAYTATDLESCITKELEYPAPERSGLYMSKIDGKYSDIRISLKETPLAVKDTEVVIKNICDGSGGGGNPCTIFINHYRKSDTARTYFYTEQFGQGDTAVIFAVGQTKGNGLITTINRYGNIIWEKAYPFASEPDPVTFMKVIEINPLILARPEAEKAENRAPAPATASYVLHASTGKVHYLVGIDGSGNVRWNNRVEWEDSDIHFLLETDHNNPGFYTVLSDRNQLDTAQNPSVIRYDAAGNPIAARTLFVSGGAFIINAASSDNYGISLAGRFIGSLAVVVHLDAGLALRDCYCVENIHATLHDIKQETQNNYIISGYLSEHNSLFVARMVSGEMSTLSLIPGTANEGARLAVGNNAVYFLEHNDFDGIVHKIKPDLSFEWSRAIRPTANPANGIQLIQFNRNTSRFTFPGYNQAVRSIIIHTDEELTSCQTVNVQVPRPELIDTLIKRREVNFKALSVRVTRVELVSEPISSDKIEYCPCDDGGGTSIGTTDTTSLQSPNFYLQAAGSTGADGSARGIHLRWTMNGALGKKHLPKGDYASSTYNFNKPNDYVTLYRAPYIKAITTLSLSVVPDVVDDSNKVWIYRINGKALYVCFRNAIRYTQVRQSINPLTSPASFISLYGSELIEVENKKQVFFAVRLILNGVSSGSSLKAETTSVKENALAIAKTTTLRKSYPSAQLSGGLRMVCENGRSVRIKTSGCTAAAFEFEFYDDFIAATNQRRGWKLTGQFALTLSDAVAFARLEPTPGLIDGHWPRFNDNAYVNINNYKTKWNGPREPWDRNIQMVVDKYIDLSNDPANPAAVETVALTSGGTPGPDDTMDISNLDLLNIASYDYHIARMLGLGTLDVSTTVMTGEYIYAAAYVTFGDLEDGGGARRVDHLSMSLPTAITDERLPIPVDLREIAPGAFWGNESDTPVSITGDGGYSHDGKFRYVTLYNRELPEDQTNKAFYYSTYEFIASNFTFPVYAGIEYRKVKNGQPDPGVWEKPELPNDPRYLNKVPAGQQQHYETIVLALPDPEQPLYVHKEDVSGRHYYSSYGINWFSRATSSSITLSVQTDLKPVNPLKPPSNINALLVREESPLLLTSVHEQNRLHAIPLAQDHTLIRLTFDYHTMQEMVGYKVPADSVLTDTQLVTDPTTLFPDADEIIADKVDIYFKNQVPNSISGKALTITDDPSNPLLSVITTGDYVLISIGETLHPSIPAGTENNYLGGVFIMGNQQYIIHSIILPFGAMQGPTFNVYKKEISDGIVTNEIPTINAANLQSPTIVADGLFTVVENMQNNSSWGTPNPKSLHVTIGNNWPVYREVVRVTDADGLTERHVEKTRGIWKAATVTPETGAPGSYTITFDAGYSIPEHAQYNATGTSVEWYQGIVRIHTVLDPNGPRKLLRVDKIVSLSPLTLSAFDASYTTDSGYDPVQTGSGLMVNFYPGYKVYLYASSSDGYTSTNILPAPGEGVRYSIFGLRSVDLDKIDVTGDFYKSRISIPQLMFAQELADALVPLPPEGALYATRPDTFGRATYTFTTKYGHQPHGVLMYRSNDEALLNVLYEQTTVAQIRAALKALGGNDEVFMANRWRNFLDFTALSINGDYLPYPPATPGNYKFPNPDKQALFDWANSILQKLGLPLITEAPGTLAAGHARIFNFVKGAIYNAFVPLTELPVIYQYIKPPNYIPVAKAQTIRDRDGNLLKPSLDPGAEFDMAPMMKRTGGTGFETQFTDFTLDGTSANIYFYGCKELNLQMKMSDFSPFLGPVKLVNTNPPEAPEIKRIMPVLMDVIYDVSPSIQLEVNAYPEVQNVRKLTIYRAYNKLDAQSVRTMVQVKVIDLDAAGLTGDPVWLVNDTFDDLTEIPYSEALYYRVTVSRKVEYADKNGAVITEYAPSLPSKLSATVMIEGFNPDTPRLKYISEPITGAGVLNQVMLTWNKCGYKCTYHVYKMNASGNWTKIHQLTGNDPVFYLLLVNTDLQSSTLNTRDADNNIVYHHFKVVAENTAGMLSLEENVLTIPDTANWIDIGGIGDMTVGPVLLVR